VKQLIEKEYVNICRYVECTGSVIQGLVLFKKFYPEHRKNEIETCVAKAAQFLEDKQYTNGGWCIPLQQFIALQKPVMVEIHVIHRLQFCIDDQYQTDS